MVVEAVVVVVVEVVAVAVVAVVVVALWWCFEPKGVRREAGKREWGVHTSACAPRPVAAACGSHAPRFGPACVVVVV